MDKIGLPIEKMKHFTGRAASELLREIAPDSILTNMHMALALRSATVQLINGCSLHAFLMNNRDPFNKASYTIKYSLILDGVKYLDVKLGGMTGGKICIHDEGDQIEQAKIRRIGELWVIELRFVCESKLVFKTSRIKLTRMITKTVRPKQKR